MFTSFRALLILLIMLSTWKTLFPLKAQEAEPTERILYYLALDGNGIQQVHRHLLYADEVRQITYANKDVTHFGIAYDGLSVAYLSESQLWLQPFHTKEAEALTAITATDYLDNPVYSPDGRYIAYTDNGIWLMELATREASQLLTNVPINLPGEHVNRIRYYAPRQFIVDPHGKAIQLILGIQIWEWNTVGVYDLTTDTLQEFETERDVRLHTDLLLLSDGRVLLYGNNAYSGEPALHIAQSIDDINTYTKVFDFSSLAETALFAHEAIEIRPGIVRLWGTAFTIADGQLIDLQIFTFDYDLAAGTAEDISFVKLVNDINETTITGPISADGVLAPILLNVGFSDEGVPNGEARLLNLETGKLTDGGFTQASGSFQWQPQ